MTTVDLELSKGDWIVHNTHGLGQIIGLESKELMGDKKVYYEVRTHAVTYWLAVTESNSSRIRPVASTRTFNKALSIIASEPQPQDENYRKRLTDIRDRIQDGSLLSKALLIRDLNARNVQKDIHVNERKILDTLQQQFINEWVLACHIKPDYAANEMRKALKKSSANIKPKKPIF